MNNHDKKTKMSPDFIETGSISRRRFIEHSFISLAGISTLGLYACTGSLKMKKSLRVIAYNVLKCTGWPPDNVTDKNQIPTLIAQELARYNPDIINFSESPDEFVVKEIAEQLKMNYVRFPSAGNWPGTLLTHFRIVDSANVPMVSGSRPEALFTRHWGKATVEVPGYESILVHSAHLFPHDTPEARIIRQQEISEILKSVKEDMEKNRSVLVIGDLNHTPAMPEYSQWMDAKLTDSFTKAGKGDGLTIRADVPNKRIDYILAAGPLANNIIESRPLFEGGFRTNPSDPQSFALSDHIPQYAEFGL